MKVQGRQSNTRSGSDADRRPEKPSIPTLNHVIAGVNIRLPGCIVLRSSWGKVLIRLLFRVVGLDISESPRRSIVFGPHALLSSPFLSFSRPLPLPSLVVAIPSLSFLDLSRFNSLGSLCNPPLRRSPLGRPLFPCSESSRPEVIRCLEEYRRGGSGAMGSRSVDGVFRGGDMESGNSCLAGQSRQELYRFSTRHTILREHISCGIPEYKTHLYRKVSLLRVAISRVLTLLTE